MPDQTPNQPNFFFKFIPKTKQFGDVPLPVYDDSTRPPPLDFSGPRSFIRNGVLGAAQGVADTGDMLTDPLGSAVAAYAGLHNLLAPHLGWNSYSPDQIADVQRQVPRPFNKVLGHEIGAHPVSQGLSWLENRLGLDLSTPQTTADMIARYGGEAVGGALAGGGIRSLLKSPTRGRIPGAPEYTSKTGAEMASDNAKAAAAADDPNYVHSGLEVWDARPVNMPNVRPMPKVTAYSQFNDPDSYARAMTPQFSGTYNKASQDAYETAYEAWSKWKADLNQNK